MNTLDDSLIPPENLALVAPGIYRSSFPKKRNFEFLRKLGLKTVIYLCPEDYPSAVIEFYKSIGAKLLQFGVQGNKEPFVDIPDNVITQAVQFTLYTDNHPLLIHCNKGKHRTGCLVGCVRRVQQWGLSSIFDEYRRFSAPKDRFMDQQFIELWTPKPSHFEKPLYKIICDGSKNESISKE